jgi:hypothetical protein
MSAHQSNARRMIRPGEHRGPVRLCEYSCGVVNGRTDRETIAVILRVEEDGPCEINLILQAWGEGIGWYPQKTIRLDPSQIDPLQRVLGIAKGLACREPPHGQPGGVILRWPSRPSGEDR